MRGDTKVALINVLNFFDGLLTLYAIHYGVEETNPLMRWLLGFGPAVFLLAKISIVLSATWVIDKLLFGNTKENVLTVLLLTYAFVSAWHLYGALLVCEVGGGP
jgi:hypothetical protein